MKSVHGTNTTLRGMTRMIRGPRRTTDKRETEQALTLSPGAHGRLREYGYESTSRGREFHLLKQPHIAVLVNRSFNSPDPVFASTLIVNVWGRF
jgi:hypothetical protein